MKQEQDDNKRFVAALAIMSLYAVLQLPFTVTEWLRINNESGDTVPVLLAIMVWIMLGFIGIGIHAITAAVTTKGYMLRRLGLQEYKPLDARLEAR